MAQPSLPGDDRGPRLAALDAARGVALLAMIAYHFSWDLADFHIVGWNVASGPGWQVFARTVASSFLIIVGISLVLSLRHGFRPAAFLRRLVILIVAAALVSFGTWWFAGDALAFFGILHLIAVGSVVALPLALFAPSWLVGLAAVAVFAAPQYLAAPVFNAPSLWWLGLTTVTPRSVDYVPLLPWLAPILIGILAGRALLGFSAGSPLVHWRPGNAAARLAAWAGRWSLAIYLIHQPVLIGILSVVAPWIPPDPAIEQTVFTRDCTQSCAAIEREAPFCAAYCSCVFRGIGGTDLMTAVRGGMTADQTTRWSSIIGQCRMDDADAPSGE
ncbi:MAG: heparan-alpha-glucosaminide N-acetyltransferase [Bauldia sp.]